MEPNNPYDGVEIHLMTKEFWQDLWMYLTEAIIKTWDHSRTNLFLGTSRWRESVLSSAEESRNDQAFEELRVLHKDPLSKKVFRAEVFGELFGSQAWNKNILSELL